MIEGTNRQGSTETLSVADWDACDEHETTFPKGDDCPKCIENYEPPDPDGECFRGGEYEASVAQAQANILRDLK